MTWQRLEAEIACWPIRVTPQRLARIRQVLDRRQPDLRVFMENIVNEHNVNAIVRTCDAVGVLFLHYVSDRELPISPGVSRGSTQWVKLVRARTLREGLESLRVQGYQIVAAHPLPEAFDYRTIDYTRPTVILLGNEAVGLSEEALAWSDWAVHIPMYGMVRSLNVSVAAAVILYEAERQRRLAGFYDRPRLPESLYRELLYRWAVLRGESEGHTSS